MNVGNFGDPVFQWNRVHWVQIGLASYCRMSDNLGVFTHLAIYSDWIRSISDSGIIKSSEIYHCDKSASCGCGQTDVNLTVSGMTSTETAVKYSWPMAVSLQVYGRHICSGTILSDSFILTSATCVFYVEHGSNISIVAGIHSLSQTNTITRTVNKIYLHPNYSDYQRYMHNIAIFHLDRPLPLVNMSSTIAKICVSNNSELLINEYPEPGSQLVVIGWDTDPYSVRISDDLRQISVKSLNNIHRLCPNFINNVYEFCTGVLHNNNKTANINYFCRGKIN